MSFQLPPLPYAPNALEPHIDARTMEIHHGKHHQAYVTNLNNAIAGTDAEKMSIEDICKNISTDLRVGSLVYALAMITFYWLIVYWMDKKKIYIKV